jgi:hypothetical protein
LQLPLVGFEFDGLYYHMSSFTAFVDPNDSNSFRVPRSKYNPLRMKESVRCKSGSCARKPHIIVPEGHYAGAPFDRELYEAVRGKRVDIEIGPVVKGNK